MAAPKPIGFDNWRAFFFLSKDGSGNKFWIKGSFCMIESLIYGIYRGPSILSVSCAAAVATVTTGEAHGFHLNQVIRLHNLPNNMSALAGVDVVVLSTPSATTFTVASPGGAPPAGLDGVSFASGAYVGAIAGVSIGAGIAVGDYTMAPGRLCVEDYPDAWELPFEG